VHPTRFTLITDADQRSVPVFWVNVTDSHCLVIMLEIRHPNILRAESIICGAGKTHTLLVQPYVGNLVEYFEDMLLNRIVDLLDIILSVQNVFRQIIDGIIYLIEHDLYHGDLKLENTYFCMDNHKPVIKLANFIEWTAPPAFDSEKLKSEWFHIGNALDQVVELITKYKPEADLRCLCEMKDLAVELKSGRTTPDEKKELAPRHFFFWSPEKRASIFIYNIPNSFKDQVFVDTVIKTFICPPGFIWSEADYGGLLAIMNDYRELKFRTKYMGQKKTHYLKFVSGCYTHEKEFTVNCLINAFVVEHRVKRSFPLLGFICFFVPPFLQLDLI
jgi:hypothetical protein